MSSNLLRVLTLSMLLGACARSLPLSDPVVGSPLGLLDELASTDTEPTGDVSIVDLERMSSNAQLRWGTTELGGLQFSFHNHLEQEVEQTRLRVVILSDEGGVRSDRTYEWAAPVDAIADSSWLNISTKRVPVKDETFAWGIVGATKR
jgi:hypothetical protein